MLWLPLCSLSIVLVPVFEEIDRNHINLAQAPEPACYNKRKINIRRCLRLKEGLRWYGERGELLGCGCCCVLRRISQHSQRFANFVTLQRVKLDEHRSKR